MRELTKKEKVEVMKSAKDILLAEDYGMCNAIADSLAVLLNIQQEGFILLPKYFPEFNYRTAVEKFNSDGTESWFWWYGDFRGTKCRLEYFDYLIKLYSE